MVQKLIYVTKKQVDKFIEALRKNQNYIDNTNNHY